MGITSLTRDTLSSKPSIVRLQSTDTLATIFASGYLTAQLATTTALNSGAFEWSVGDMVAVEGSNGNQMGYFDGDDFATILTLPGGNGAVTLPVVSGDFVVFDGTLGSLKDNGYSASDSAKTKVVMAGSAVAVNSIAHFVDTAGTIDDTAATVTNAGSIQAGASGTAGTFISYPSAATSGTLVMAAATNGSGNFSTTISNATAIGQSQVISIPDVGAATGQFLVKTASLVSGNFPQNSGTAGLMVDSGLAVTNVVSKIAANTFSGSGQIILAKANGTETGNAVTASGNAGVITTSALTTAAGSSYAITWTNTKITATSVIALTIQGGTNTVQSIQFSCVPGSGSATLTIYNIGPTSALNGTILIGYSVL